MGDGSGVALGACYSVQCNLCLQAFHFRNMKWRLWDRWALQGDSTVQEVFDWFKVSLHCKSSQVTASHFGCLPSIMDWRCVQFCGCCRLVALRIQHLMLGRVCCATTFSPGTKTSLSAHATPSATPLLSPAITPLLSPVKIPLLLLFLLQQQQQQHQEQ